MTAKEKYLALLGDVVANEAISNDKLKLLIKKHRTNRSKTIPWLRKGGVLEDMGQDVNRVLVRGKHLEAYADWLVEQASPKKKEVLDMSLPEKWENTVKEPPHDLFEESDTHAKATPPYHEIMGDRIETAEEDIDMHSRMLEMINGVQETMDKQNEYIAKRIVGLEEKLNNLPSVLDEVEEHLDFHRQQHGMYTEHDKRIAQLENRMNMCGEEIEGLDDKIDSQVNILEDRMKEQTLIGSKNGMLKALHQLLGELI